MEKHPIEQWNKFCEKVISSPTKYTLQGQGFVRGIQGEKIWIDFGSNNGPISLAEITFRERKDAEESYCSCINLELEIKDESYLVSKKE